MKQAAKYSLIFLIFIIVSLSAGSSFACGTVRGWVDNYFNEKRSNRDDALYKIHCRPVARHYRATPSEHEALARMIKKGLNAMDYCDRVLAVKSFFLFDQLYWLKGTELYDELVSVIETKIKRPVQEISGELSLYEQEDRDDYCARVGYEIKGMIWNSESVCITKHCRTIDISRLEEKSKRLSSFMKRAVKCLNDTTDRGTKNHIVQVNTDTLYIRKKPAPRDTVLATLQRGDFLFVTSKRGDWLKVLDRRCKEGWVAGYLTKNARGN